jgi:outer membrane receptor for ferrienterochelin and colicin
MKYLLSFLFISFLISNLSAQPRGNFQGPPPGKVYGKILGDNKTPVEYAIVKVIKIKKISEDSTIQELVNGALTASNGDFQVDKVPVNQDLVLEVQIIGYEKKQVPFKLTPSGFGAVEKDLGNIQLKPGEAMKAVVVEAESSAFRIEFDKRVYDVDKNPMNAGGTGEDVLRNIPSLQVDIDGNVSLRNAAPQIFVDGRPTTLTIDQIPADAIQRVEIITNPSAKYDASGGGGGIINIVMKNNRSTGYNGSVRAGVDRRGRVNSGLDFNFREGKFNFFVNGNYNRRKNISYGFTERTDLTQTPITFLNQTQNNDNVGYFLNGKIGVDWFIDNRSTLTLSQSYTRGQFNPTDYLETSTDTLTSFNESLLSFYYRNSVTNRQFRNAGTSLLYKRLYAKEGRELNADVNLNLIASEFEGEYLNAYDNGFRSEQRQIGEGAQELYTAQVDYEDRILDKYKFELGARAAIRNFRSQYSNFFKEEGVFVDKTALGVNYRFLDQVFALYSNVSRDGESWKTQFGLRAESSDYRGELIDTNVTFKNVFPISLFPSAYITRVINEKQDIQLALNRRVNRPSFMQLIPFTDYSDSLNVSRGNPALKPEFTYSAELSYQYTFSNKNTFIGSVYYRFTDNTTVRYLLNEFSPILNQDVIITTYDNAQTSTAAGLELVYRATIKSWLDVTTNFNLYNSTINGSNIDANLTNNVSTYWVKTNLIFKLPQQYIFQANFDYSSRRALNVGSTERGGGGGGGGGFGGGGRGGFGGTENTVQGFVKPQYGLDVSLRKEFFKKTLSVTISVSDVLATRITETFSESEFFIQESWRRRDPQLWRVQVSWKFGKMDSSLFRRKNTRQNSEGMEG